MQLPFSQACENNKAPILTVLKNHFSDVERVLEVGSGTGQHAVHFAEHLPHLSWQCTDRAENIAAINSRLQWASLANTPEPLVWDVNDAWPVDQVPAVFTANTLHIMSWREVELLFQRLDGGIAATGLLCVYGPFNYNGQYTSDSNARFDEMLKARDPLSGIRDIETIRQLAESVGLQLLEDYAMPANNRCLVWQRQA